MYASAISYGKEIKRMLHSNLNIWLRFLKPEMYLLNPVLEHLVELLNVE